MSRRFRETDHDALRLDPYAVATGFTDRAPQRVEPDAAIPSRLLFGVDRRMVTIDHEGERYRLQITRAGKLLLTK